MRAVLFDFDGVLVDSEPLHFRAMRAALVAEGFTIDEEEYWRHLLAHDDRGAIRIALERHGLPYDGARIEAVRRGRPAPRHPVDAHEPHGPERGLRLLDALAARDELRAYHLLPAARADLLRRLGRREEAARAYREALALVTLEPERRFLESRLSALNESRTSAPSRQTGNE